MGEGVAPEQSRTDVALFKHGVVGVNLGDALLAQPDVEHAEVADERLVLGKEHAQLLMLQRQCHVGSDDVRTYIICIVLGHQARRDVDADDFGRRGIDVLDQ